MIRSEDRILTTHTGSLPRPEKLVQLMFAKEEGQEVDPSELSLAVKQSVREVVERQLKAGIDIVNDGEVSKPSYATYIKDRLTGFGGESASLVYQDLSEFPAMAERVFNDPGRSRRKTPGCNSKISVHDQDAVFKDIENLKEHMEATSFGYFLNAASPGVISLFFSNSFYPDFETYLFAIAEAMRYEYQAIVDAGISLQIDCPDLAMGRHIQYASLETKAFRQRAELHVDALNYSLEGIDADKVRLHLCWGNYEGPHHCDIPLNKIIDIAFKANVSGISFEAANPRHAHEYVIFDDLKIPDDIVLIPGVVESKSNFIEHPEVVAERLIKYSTVIPKDQLMAGTDCGFSTFAGFGKIDENICYEKLHALVEGTKLASKII